MKPLLVALCAALLGGVFLVPDAAAQYRQPAAAPEHDASAPLPGTDPEAYARGRELFTREFSADGGPLGLEDGLQYAVVRPFTSPARGPIGTDYNGTSCVSCHDIGGVGGAGDPAHGSFMDTFRFNSVLGEYPYSYDSYLRPRDDFFAALASESRPMHAVRGEHPATWVTDLNPRTPTSLFGLGVLDQISDEYIVEHCGVNEELGIHGRPMIDDGVVMRFGRRGAEPHLLNFVAAAFTLELGIVNGLKSLPHLPPPEIPEADVRDTAAFVAGLPPPPSLPPTQPGQALFHSVGCAICHDPARQGTDQCSHDMGGQLINDYDTFRIVGNAFSWRTARLVGNRFAQTFLHDGRARSIREAVSFHGGGETRQVKEHYDALSEADRAALIQYVGTL